MVMQRPTALRRLISIFGLLFSLYLVLIPIFVAFFFFLLSMFGTHFFKCGVFFIVISVLIFIVLGAFYINVMIIIYGDFSEPRF